MARMSGTAPSGLRRTWWSSLWRHEAAEEGHSVSGWAWDMHVLSSSAYTPTERLPVRSHGPVSSAHYHTFQGVHWSFGDHQASFQRLTEPINVPFLNSLSELYFAGNLSHKYQFLVLLPIYQIAMLKYDCLWLWLSQGQQLILPLLCPGMICSHFCICFMELTLQKSWHDVHLWTYIHL